MAVLQRFLIFRNAAIFFTKNKEIMIEAKGNAKLFDEVIWAKRLKNDAGLARALKVDPPVISKMRNDKLNVGSAMILKIHETFDMPVKQIRELMAQ